MTVEFPPMLLPLMLATALLLSGLLAYGTAMHLIVRVLAWIFRRRSSDLGYWKNVAVMAIVTLITAVAHLTQIALWAAAFVLSGLVSTVEAAVLLSAQNFTSFGYGDVLLSRTWRLLCPLEGMIGLLFFGLSTAVLFAIMNHMIIDRLRTEIGNPNEAAGHEKRPSPTGDAWSTRPSEFSTRRHPTTAEDAS